MAIGSSLEVLGFLEVKVAYYVTVLCSVKDPTEQRTLLTDDTRAQVPILSNNGNQFVIRLFTSSVSVHVDRQWLRNWRRTFSVNSMFTIRTHTTNGIRKLDKDATSQASLHQRFR